MDERLLRQGEVVRVEFDRKTAPLGMELAQPDVLTGELSTVARVLPPDRRIDEDYNASSYLLEFVIATASGVTATALTGLVKEVVERLAERRRTKVSVGELSKAPSDDSLRLGVRELSD